MTLCSANVDQVLNQAWEQASKSDTKSTTAQGMVIKNCTPSLVRRLWNLRHQLRRPRIATQANIFRQWFIAIKLQQITRQVRKAHRQRKQNLINQVLSSQSVFRASRRLPPEQPRRRLQLRDQDGRLQTYEGEFSQIMNYYHDLYAGPCMPCGVMSQPLHVTLEEMLSITLHPGSFYHLDMHQLHFGEHPGRRFPCPWSQSSTKCSKAGQSAYLMRGAVHIWFYYPSQGKP